MRRFFAVLAFAASLSLAGAALADPQSDFVKGGHTQLSGLLKQPASAQRDTDMGKVFDQLIDYDELTKRCFGPDWTTLKPEQQTEMVGLIKRLVQKNYRKNLKRTLDYDVTFTGAGPQGTDTRVKTEAKNKTNARDTVQVDYVVQGPAAGPFKIVDIYTEGASLTNGYRTQFHTMLTTAGQGYTYMVQKINEKLAKPD